MPQAISEKDSDGWVQIAKGRKKISTTLHKPAAEDRSMTIEQIKKDYETKKTLWLASSCHQQTCRILDRAKPDDGWKLSKALCLATGSFSRENLSNRKRSMFQFVAFMQIAERIQLCSANPIQLFAQEPLYTAVDEQFLSSLRVSTLRVVSETVGDSLGEAGAYVGPNTLVFEPFMGLGPDAIDLLIGCGMSLYIGSSINKARVGKGSHSATARAKNTAKGAQWEETRLDQFADEFERTKFPAFDEDPQIFEGIHIQWRRQHDGDDATG